MKMLVPNHFVCHFIIIFCILLAELIRQNIMLQKKLMTSSDSVCKTMSHCFIQSVSNLVYHLYSICRMYSEENPQGFPPYSSSPLFLSVSNAVSECRSCFKLGNSLP